ncbi:hypothetical protein BS78_01G185100 [Paspalum vaginatum]|nr:hypothetical protein BS78_01G185100 [Paspalum vaginatum]
MFSSSMKILTWRMLLLLACILLIAELASFGPGRRVDAGEDERSASSVEKQMYKLPRTEEHLGSGSGSPPGRGRTYEASARPVPQGSNPLHNR